jgi:hypothetical protein
MRSKEINFTSKSLFFSFRLKPSSSHHITKKSTLLIQSLTPPPLASISPHRHRPLPFPSPRHTRCTRCASSIQRMIVIYPHIHDQQNKNFSRSLHVLLRTYVIPIDFCASFCCRFCFRCRKAVVEVLLLIT